MNLAEKNITYLDGLLKPLMPYYDTIGKFGDWESGQGANMSWLEMFARSTYGVCALTAIAGDNIYIRKFNSTIHKVIHDPRYTTWQDEDQKAVELVPIISLLLIHRDLTWNTYITKEQQDLLTFFSNINAIHIGGDNWQFFRILVTRGIIELGGNQDPQFIEDSWKKVDECYCGDGWYQDGKNGAKDYYVAFGYHYYSLLYRYLFPNDEKCNIIKERALAFAKDYQYFFDTEGRMIVYGRSMIYRCASLAFWSIALCNNNLLDTEFQARALTIIDKGLEWWVQQPITNTEGLLTLGIAYRNEYVCENYNSSGSPYWMMKAFAFMLANNENLTIRGTESLENKAPEIKTIANGDIMVVHSTQWNTAFINSSLGGGYVPNRVAKYMRFAYNSMTGFNLSRESNDFKNLSDDNSLIFNIAGIKHQRETNDMYINHEAYQEFKWRCGDLIKIHSFVIPQMDGYIRVHIVNSKLTLDCYETGFAIGLNSGAVSGVQSLYGNGEVLTKNNAVNSNIYHPHTIMQCIIYHIYKGTNLIADYTYLREKNMDAVDIQNGVRVLPICGRILIGPKNTISIPLRYTDIIAIHISKIKNRMHRVNVLMRNRIRDVYNNTAWLKGGYRKIKQLIK